MKKVSKIILTAFLGLNLFSSAVFAEEHTNLTSEDALKKLKQGNEHFIKMKLQHPDQSKKRREELVKGQHPFVIIITCSDSRVPPEIIFDQGLGDIFEIRNAGNVFDDHVIGSVEYAVSHLGVNLVVVMGHQDCGAVKATIEHAHDSRFIESLVKSIEPAVKMADKQQGDKLDNSIKNNAVLGAKELVNTDAVVSEHIKSGKLKVIPAYYNIDSGKVDFYN